jgi:hypothetical protein
MTFCRRFQQQGDEIWGCELAFVVVVKEQFGKVSEKSRKI